MEGCPQIALNTSRAVPRGTFARPPRLSHLTRKLIIHIGTEKTGTSSIQTFLRDHRRHLMGQKVLYPRAPGDLNHTRLSAYAMDDERREDVHFSTGVRTDDDLKRFRVRLHRKLRAEIARRSPDCVVVSDEHFHSRLRSTRELERLRDLLEPLAQTIEVVVYLRRQDEMAASAYASHLKFGSCLPPIDAYLEGVEGDDAYYQLEALVDRWRGVFGRDQVTARVFERARLHDGDVLEDFLQICGIDAGDDWNRPGRINGALEYQALEYLRRFNPHSPRIENGCIDPRRARLVRILERHFGGGKHLPSRRVAEDLYGRFHESNERLRRALGLEDLFHNDFSAYPDHAHDDPFTAEQATAVAALLWREMGRPETGNDLWSRLARAAREPGFAIDRIRERLQMQRGTSVG